MMKFVWAFLMTLLLQLAVAFLIAGLLFVFWNYGVVTFAAPLVLPQLQYWFFYFVVIIIGLISRLGETQVNINSRKG